MTRMIPTIVGGAVVARTDNPQFCCIDCSTEGLDTSGPELYVVAGTVLCKKHAILERQKMTVSTHG